MAGLVSSRIVYGALVLVFVICVSLIYWLSNNPAAQALLTLPLVGVVGAALYQLFRDQLAHDRSAALTDLQHRFTLGATSHMANVAFDKLVTFSEEYITEVHDTLAKLFRNGPTNEALGHASKLYRIRQKHTLWLTPYIDKDLEVFESSLRKLGADAHWIDAMKDDPNRPKVVARLFDNFANLMGRELMGAEQWEGEELDEDRAISMVIHRLRVTLGIEELTKMRTALMKKAAI